MFYVGILKGVGRIYRQTFNDTYSKLACAKLYLAIEDIDYSRTRACSPRSNVICEHFHKTLLQEFYQVAFRQKIYHSLDELQADG